MPKPKKMWVYAPKKPTPPKAPEALKREVETKANALVESVLKPLHVKEPGPDPHSTTSRASTPSGTAATSTSARTTSLPAPMRWRHPSSISLPA